MVEQNARKIIIARMKKRRLKPGDLWRLVKGKKICRATIYNLLRGENIRSDKMDIILEALGLAIK